MKLIIEATAKEVADLVSELRDRREGQEITHEMDGGIVYKAVQSAIRDNRASDNSVLDAASTHALVEELKKRKGVERHEIGPSATATINTDGPAIVLVVID